MAAEIKDTLINNKRETRKANVNKKCKYTEHLKERVENQFRAVGILRCVGNAHFISSCLACTLLILFLQPLSFQGLLAF